MLFKNGEPFDVDKAMDDRATPENMKKMLSIFGEVLNLSFKLFTKEVSITSININAIYILAKKYGVPTYRDCCKKVDVYRLGRLDVQHVCLGARHQRRRAPNKSATTEAITWPIIK